MEYNTSELCDIYLDKVDVVEPMFSSYGGRSSFGGQVTTVKCFEDCGLIRHGICKRRELAGCYWSMAAAR